MYVEIEVVEFYLSSKVDAPTSESAHPRVRASCVINSPSLRVHKGTPSLNDAMVSQCALHLQTKDAARGSEVVSGSNGLFFSIAYDESFPVGVEAEVFLYVDQRMFDKLVQDMQQVGRRCLISFKTSEADFALKTNILSVTISDVEFRFQSTLLPGRARINVSTEAYDKVVEDCCLTGYQHNNFLGTIGFELTQSLVKGNAIPSKYQLEKLGDLLDDLKRGFHAYHLGDGLPDGLFQKNPADFEKALEDFPDKQKHALRASYSMVWLHTPMESVATNGELATGSAKNYLTPNIEVIEELGQIYCSNPNYVSPSLEWVIVNSLVYVEVLGFHREIAQEYRKLPYNKPLGPVTIKKQILEQGLHTLGRVAKEVVAWVITWVVAGFISKASSIGVWPIFLGITAVRWIRPKKDYKTEAMLQHVKLATGMSSAYSRMSGTNFSASLMLAHLHSLEIQGAVFKSTIYNVLDKRQARVGAAPP